MIAITTSSSMSVNAVFPENADPRGGRPFIEGTEHIIAGCISSNTPRPENREFRRGKRKIRPEEQILHFILRHVAAGNYRMRKIRSPGGNMEDIKSIVKDYILKEFLPGETPDNLTESTPLVTGGILDSIATLKLVSFLEEKYAIRVEPHEADVDNLNTLNDIERYVKSKLPNA
jgi:acyl carrier protein